MLCGYLLCAALTTLAPPRPLADLRQLLAAAVGTRAHQLVIPPGVYRGAPERGSKTHLSLRNVSDLNIVADGVTMICTEPTRALELNNCTRVTLRGLTIDYDPLPFTQGDVVTVNPAEGWLDIKIHAGYPVEAYDRIDICDRQTRYRKRDKPFMWDSKAAVRPDGIVRVTSKSAAGFAQVGDLASLGGFPPGVVAHTLVIDDSAQVTLDHVTVHASNCMGIIASGGDGGHRFLSCRVVPGPTPAGATEPRILSSNADAMLTGTMRLGALIEDCEIRDAGDDSWSVQSSDYVILKRDGRTLWLAARASTALHDGDRLQASLDGPIGIVGGRRSVRRRDVELSPEISAKLAASGPWGYWKLFDGPTAGTLQQVTLDSDPPWKEGDSVCDLDRMGNGFVFRRNVVRSSGRVLIKAAGLVEDNRIEGPYGLAVNPEVPYPAAVCIADIVIRGNTVRGAHEFNPYPTSPQAGAISVTAENDATGTMRPGGCYGNVVIERNTVEGGNGVGIVVSAARNASLRGNRLVGLQRIAPHATGSRYTIDNHAAVCLSQCGRVVLSDNVLLDPGPFLSQPLVRGPGVAELVGDLTQPQR